MDSALRRESQVLNVVNFISCRTWSGVLKEERVSFVKRTSACCTSFLAYRDALYIFFYADLNTVEWGALSIALVQQ